jgi:hypothetical protein
VARPLTASRGSHSGCTGAILSKQIERIIAALKGDTPFSLHAKDDRRQRSTGGGRFICRPGATTPFALPTRR